MRRNKFDCGYSFDINSGDIFEHGNEHGFSCYKGNPIKKAVNSVKKTIASPSRLVTSTANIATGGLYGAATGKQGAFGGLDSPTSAAMGGAVGAAGKGAVQQSYNNSQKDAYEAKLFDMQANSLNSQTNIANQQELRSQDQYNEYKKTYAPAETKLAADIQGKYQDQNTASMNNFINNNSMNTNAINRSDRSLTNNYNSMLDYTTGSHNAGMKKFEAGAAYDTSSLANDFTSGSKSLSDGFSSSSNAMAGQFAAASDAMAGRYSADAKSMSDGYANQIMGYTNDMGKADTDILGRTKANAYAGVDTGFSNAQKQMYADLARRGMGNSGIFAKASLDLAGAKAADYSARGVGAYNDAVSQSDGRRGSKIQVAGEGYNARSTSLRDGYNARNASLGAGYGAKSSSLRDTYNAQSSTLRDNYGAQSNVLSNNILNDRNQRNTAFSNTQASLAGQFNNTLAQNTNAYNRNNSANANNYTAQTANTQQSIANMTGLAQLGRGMQSNSQNYLGQAGSTFGQNAQISGNTAVGIGNQMVNLQSAQMQAQAQRDAGKGAMTGSIVGAGVTGAALMSDERLKENIKSAGEFYGYSFYTWDWNEEGLKLADPNQPTFGVMAQEVRRINPRAVTMADDGYYRVDYNMIMGGAL